MAFQFFRYVFDEIVRQVQSTSGVQLTTRYQARDHSQKLREVVECRADMFDFVIVQIQVLELNERTEYLWINVGDEVLAQTQSLEMSPEAR